MAINIVKGGSKDLIVKLTTGDGVDQDPFNLTGINFISACFEGEDGDDVDVFFLVMTGNIVSASVVISAIADTSNIHEGDPITGTGIPIGATVLKTPASEVSPTAPGTILISIGALATTVGVSLTIGTISVVSAIYGKIKIGLRPVDTDQMEAGPTQDFEVKIIDSASGAVMITQFPKSLNVVERFCT